MLEEEFITHNYAPPSLRELRLIALDRACQERIPPTLHVKFKGRVDEPYGRQWLEVRRAIRRDGIWSKEFTKTRYNCIGPSWSHYSDEVWAGTITITAV